MFVRTSFDKYEERVNLFFKEVLSRVKDLQFYTSNGLKGGPIIAVQVCLQGNLLRTNFDLKYAIGRFNNILFYQSDCRLKTSMVVLVMTIILETSHISII